jgi:hypothetical protein
MTKEEMRDRIKTIYLPNWREAEAMRGEDNRRLRQDKMTLSLLDQLDCPACQPLKEFARHIISQECWGNYTVDGADIQEKAEELKLISLDNVTADDVKNLSYYTKDDIGESTIYRFTDILKEQS